MTNDEASFGFVAGLNELLGEIEDMATGSKGILGLLYEKVQELDGAESVQIGAMISALMGTLDACIDRIELIDGMLDGAEITVQDSDSVEICEGDERESR